jgi:hypothetical protein
MAKMNVKNTEITIISVEDRDYISITDMANANEADVLNVALFGLTAKQWRDLNPNLKEISVIMPQ